MSPSHPRRVSVTPQKIAELVFDRIFPIMQGEPTDAMVLSLICAATLAMEPHCPPEKLQRIILDVSGHLVNQLQDVPEVPEGHVN